MVIKKRLNIQGNAIVFVTATVTDWLPILIKKDVINIIISELKTTLVIYGISLLSYAIMPSHFHAILGFKSIEKLSKFMHCFKGITSRKVKELNFAELNSDNFRLWKPRFDDLIISSQK